jgi:hypothetical protein
MEEISCREPPPGCVGTRAPEWLHLETMSDAFPIHDLFIRPLAQVEEPGITRWPALADSDSLLRRFGQAEVVRVSPDRAADLRLRRVADEVWALIEGTVEFAWLDLRPGSPSTGFRHQVTCARPTLVLAPFGVAFGMRALAGPALLLRLATHAESDPASQGDLTLPWEATA